MSNPEDTKFHARTTNGVKRHHVPQCRVPMLQSLNYEVNPLKVSTIITSSKLILGRVLNYCDDGRERAGIYYLT